MVVGTRGTGKTTFIKRLLNVHPAEKVLIFDTDDNVAFHEYDAIDAVLIPHVIKGTFRVINPNFELVLDCIDEGFRNGLLILEDATKYVGSIPPKNLQNIILASKQRNVDVLMTFHGFRSIAPRLYAWTNMLELFKTGENLDKISTKNNIPQLEKVLAVAAEVEAHPSKFHHKSIRLA